MYKMTVGDAQALCLRKNIPFYSYRLPGESDFHFGAQLGGEVKKFDKLGTCVGNDGFVVVPFRETEINPSLFIRCDFGFINSTDRPDWFEIPVEKAAEAVGNDVPQSVSREEYRHQVTDMILALQQRVVRKMVLSRGLTVVSNGYENAPLWFEKLTGCYPDAFVFLVSVPGIMTWIGATPELFLRQTCREVSTMALAGTRAAGSEGAWGDKEVEEQAIVTDYIADILKKAGEWEVCGPFSKKAGQVEHLCTTFSHPGFLPVEMADRIRKDLHPTPAVGGFPPREAIDLLEKIEGKNRRYYAGYLGPVNKDLTFDWFVNLRSMEIFPQAVHLYVGGGITALSDAEKEWEETELKSRTLLEVIGE